MKRETANMLIIMTLSLAVIYVAVYYKKFLELNLSDFEQIGKLAAFPCVCFIACLVFLCLGGRGLDYKLKRIFSEKIKLAGEINSFSKRIHDLYVLAMKEKDSLVDIENYELFNYEGVYCDRLCDLLVGFVELRNLCFKKFEKCKECLLNDVKKVQQEYLAKNGMFDHDYFSNFEEEKEEDIDLLIKDLKSAINKMNTIFFKVNLLKFFVMVRGEKAFVTELEQYSMSFDRFKIINKSFLDIIESYKSSVNKLKHCVSKEDAILDKKNKRESMIVDDSSSVDTGMER
ncbi:hypothetical protein K6025_02655 [Ehrlichia sp. JZT12]